MERFKHPKIDWDAQWKEHGLGYREGLLHIDLGDFFPPLALDRWPQTLKLQPGPGFGDLSHPTTRLVLKMMGKYVKGQRVIDVGCGSGILSLAAVAMGAEIVWGIDIDDEALQHAADNSRLNGMEGKISFCRPEAFKARDNKPLIVLMNMIQSEQAQAWHSLNQIHSQVGVGITSGILCEGEAAYLKQCEQWGWKVVDRLEEDGWLGFALFGAAARAFATGAAASA